MTHTLALILFIISCLISAVASGFAFYKDEMQKKKQKEEIQKIMSDIDLISDEINKLKGEKENEF